MNAGKQDIRKNYFQKISRYALYIGIGMLLNFLISPWVEIGINSSNSVEGYVFLIFKKELPVKGEMIAFWPPENRFYKHLWFVKYVKGVEGDVVRKSGRNFYINNEYIGVAKTKSKNGLALESGKEGRIPQGHYFVWTPHQDSYDSRYKDIGWISTSRVIGRVVRLF